MEQQERKRRQMLNKEFKLFAERVAEAASTSVSDFFLVFFFPALTSCLDRRDLGG